MLGEHADTVGGGLSDGRVGVAAELDDLLRYSYVVLAQDLGA